MKHIYKNVTGSVTPERYNTNIIKRKRWFVKSIFNYAKNIKHLATEEPIMKKLIALLLTLCMVIAMSGMTAFAQDTVELKSITGKTYALLDRDENLYRVDLQVPGAEIELHDEIIVMVDGSYSTDDDWVTSVRPSLLEIGKTVLDGTGRTTMTLMTFGIGDNIVLESAKTFAELDERLPDLPGGLLYGRSSTNCEAGFNGIERYVNSKADELDNVYVIYITDGEANTDETLFDFKI